MGKIGRFEDIQAWQRARELTKAVYVAKDLNYLTAAEFDTLYQLADEISRMLSGFIKYLENSK